MSKITPKNITMGYFTINRGRILCFSFRKSFRFFSFFGKLSNANLLDFPYIFVIKRESVQSQTDETLDLMSKDGKALTAPLVLLMPRGNDNYLISSSSSACLPPTLHLKTTPVSTGKKHIVT